MILKATSPACDGMSRQNHSALPKNTKFCGADINHQLSPLMNPTGCVRCGPSLHLTRQRRPLCRRNAAIPLRESLNREPCSKECSAGDELPCKDRFARHCSSRSSTNAVHRNGSDLTYATGLRERTVHHPDSSLRIP